MNITSEQAHNMVFSVRDAIAMLDNKVALPLFASRQVVAIVLDAVGVCIEGKRASDWMGTLA